MTDRLLDKYRLRSTPIRRDVLRLFLETNRALTHFQIEQQLRGEFDRVTLYRTLKTFEERGLLHRVLNDQESIQYALCRDDCQEHKHLDNHVHFQCERCLSTFCLDEVPIPHLSLPQSYTVGSMQLLVTGVCDECNAAAGA